jgi:putative ABC transport system permease protein
MIRHYLKVIWNRKRSNLLIMLEIFLSFLVVFAVATVGLQYLDSYRQEIGFTRDNVWTVEIGTRALAQEARGGEVPQEIRETYRQVLAAARELPEVVAVAAATCTPYGHSNWISGGDFEGWRLRYSLAYVTDHFDDVLGVRLTRGRWFDSRDDGAAWVPVVINERMAGAVFGTRDPVGSAIPQERPRDGSDRPELRVVGVVGAYRQDGEFSRSRKPDNYLFRRYTTDDATMAPPQNLMIKLRPGTTAAFEEQLVRRLQAAAPEWSFEVHPLEQLRETWFAEVLAPVLAMAVVAAFLILMVAMGLTGVLWQLVTQRTREVGLRRAKGATIGDIRAQILGELVVMTSVAVLAGTALVVQLPLAKLEMAPGRIVAASLVVSAACIYLLTVACAWYPSHLATRIQPAEALHYE